MKRKEKVIKQYITKRKTGKKEQRKKILKFYIETKKEE